MIDSPIATETSPLISYVEVWLPNDDASSLQRTAARLVNDDQARRTLDTASAKLGEGIAGAAWKQKSAILLQEQPSDVLRQISASSGVDLTAVLALPVFCEHDLRGVVVLGLNGSYGAAEVWTRDDRDELALTAGHYSGLPSFEFITRYTRFPKGAGVPGNVWKNGLPQIAQDLDHSATFIRSFGNDPAKVSAAVGLPVATSGGFPASVVLLLQATDSPISRRTELISCDIQPATDTTGERIVAASTRVVGQSADEPCEGWQQSLAAEIFHSGAPAILEANDNMDAEFHMVWPVFVRQRIASIFGLTF